MPSERDKGYIVFTIDRFAILVWTKPPVAEGIKLCRQLFAEMLASGKAPFGYLTIIEPEASSNMPAPVRHDLSAMLAEYQSHIDAAAIVFEGTGFSAAIVRSVVSTITLATRPKFPNKVHADLLEGARWMYEAMRNKSGIPVPMLVTMVNKRRGRNERDDRDDRKAEASG